MAIADGLAIFEHAHRVPTGLSDAFALFADPENLERLTPRWMRFRLLEIPSRFEAGARIRYRIAPFGLATEWLAQISEWNAPHAFADVQLQGPYRRWSHTHRMTEVAGGVEIQDRIEYRLPGGLLGRAVDRLGDRAFLGMLFAYRSRRIDQPGSGRKPGYGWHHPRRVVGQRSSAGKPPRNSIPTKARIIWTRAFDLGRTGGARLASLDRGAS